ncbi:uncharacterized protein LOC128913511 [Rissa tridactyla]|uniref:uncharacterized protein LOC128913511 n=1 Tax=Rissa tridactyla TaxID=75485 RepID=UPI0023BA9DDB|nr:uncharacterized protein LOC128913511 [Rissa tridactyla]
MVAVSEGLSTRQLKALERLLLHTALLPRCHLHALNSMAFYGQHPFVGRVHHKYPSQNVKCQRFSAAFCCAVTVQDRWKGSGRGRELGAPQLARPVRLQGPVAMATAPAPAGASSPWQPLWGACAGERATHSAGAALPSVGSGGLGALPFGKDLHFRMSEGNFRDSTFKKVLTACSFLSPRCARGDFEIRNGIDCKLGGTKLLIT